MIWLLFEKNERDKKPCNHEKAQLDKARVYTSAILGVKTKLCGVNFVNFFV